MEEKNNNIIKVKCVKNITQFIEGKEYESDSRLFINEENNEDKQVIMIESTVDGIHNCFLIPLDKVLEHFEII